MVWDFWFINNTENIKPRNGMSQLIRGVTQTIRNNKQKIEVVDFLVFYLVQQAQAYWKRSEQSKQCNAQSWTRFLILPHPLTNFQIQKYY